MMHMIPVLETASKSRAFFKGVQVFPSETKAAEDYLRSVQQRVRQAKMIELVFDCDGDLYEPGLETTNNNKTLKMWADENKESISAFRQQMRALMKRKIYINTICTGRALDWAEAVANLLFPEGSVSRIIAEGGAIISRRPVQGKAWDVAIDKHVDTRSLLLLGKYRREILEELLKEGAALESSAKRIRLTFNPRQDMSGAELAEIIKAYILKLAEKNPRDSTALVLLASNITSTPTTAEIMPFGINKQVVLKERSEENIMVFFGDSNTDKAAMLISDINVAPFNAEHDIKKIVTGKTESREFLGVLPPYNNLRGVTNSLLFLDSLFGALPSKL